MRAKVLIVGEPADETAGSLGQRGRTISARMRGDPSPVRLGRTAPALPRARRPASARDSGVAEARRRFTTIRCSKVIASAETRGEAIARLLAALREYPILGIQTNIPFLLRILEHPRFQSGEADTSFLDTEGDALAHLPDDPVPAFVTAAAAAHANAAPQSGPDFDQHQETWDPWRRNAGWRP